VKGVKAPTTIVESVPQTESKSEEKPQEPIVCTLNLDFLKSLEVKETDPRSIYNDKVKLIKDSTTCKSLESLFDLGFTNYEVNIAMLEKYENDVQVTATHLCEGNLSESVIYKAFK